MPRPNQQRTTSTTAPPVPAAGRKARGHGNPTNNNQPELLLASATPATNDTNPANAPPPPPPPVVPPPVPAPPVAIGNGQQYNPTTAPFGTDMSAPGVREQLWNNNQNLWLQDPALDWVDQQQGQFADPWQGERVNSTLMGSIADKGAGQQHWAGIQGSMNQPSGAESALAGGYRGQNNAKTAFDLTQGALPGSLQPQFDAYYDRMSAKNMSNVNAQSAARGSYGSNTALNGAIGAGLDAEAQRAAAATKFSLDDSANQRQWFDSLGTMGRNADLSSLDAFGANEKAARYGLDKNKTMSDIAFKSEEMEFDKNKALSDIAFGTDEAKMNRLDAGISTAFGSSEARHNNLNDAFDAAGDVQDAREGRVNSLYDDVSGFSQDTLDFVSDNYEALLGGDQAMSEDEIRTMIAKEADARGWSQQQQDRTFRDAMGVVKAVTGSKNAGEQKKSKSDDDDVE